MSEYANCAVCERTILRGERASEYVDSDGRAVLVCPLCKGRAEAEGWMPAEFAEAGVSQQEGSRWSGTALRERLARASDAASAKLPRRPEAPLEPEPRAVAPQRPVPRGPLDVFNGSAESRQVAGLIRSLGEPQVTVRDDLVTVAWELSWYQWRIDGETIHEVDKGSELSELSEADRDWNASAGADGSISFA